MTGIPDTTFTNSQSNPAPPIMEQARPSLTMSSREIAELCEKNHADVLRDIRAMLDQLGEVASRFAGYYLAANGKQNPCFVLPKDLTLTLVAGYNVVLRKRIIDRWLELESRERPDPMVALNDPATMRSLLLSYSEKVLALEATNAALAPKADALDRLADADGSFSITEAAKALQVRPKDLFDFLSRNGWIYKRPGGAVWLGYQAHTSNGDLAHKVTTVLRADGSEKVTEQVRITAKGLTKLAKLMPGRLGPMS